MKLTLYFSFILKKKSKIYSHLRIFYCTNHKYKIMYLSVAAQTMVDMAKGKTDRVEFEQAMQDQLGEFEFPEEFVSDIWTVIGSTRGTSL